MSKQFPISGLKELDAYLSAFPKKLQANAVRSGLRQAANQIAAEAKTQAKGRISTAITVGSPHQREDGTFAIRIYVDERKYDDAYTAYFQEFGVGPHFISAGPLDTLSPRLLTRKARNEGVSQPVERHSDGSYHPQRGVLKIGESYISHGVMHPGHAAHPFMRPALDTRARQAVEAFADQVQIYIHAKTGLLAPYVEVGEAA